MEKEIFENLIWDENHRLGEAVDTLKISFGIDNLSNIEMVYLKRITKDVLDRAKKDNPGSDFAIINPAEEIPTLFLRELYGIEPNYIIKHTKTDADGQAFLEYIRRTREKAHLI
ncbi:MAG: hypothetical protein A3H57_03410 [Candidatus Taylorbacteria bacterium RIFCSPLOWO2_02_FULL_43_11]|uniref:Uncharacterized protein n=1 Tax=Candidatus Taylorbacteria bacterium RIFCSPHIGHO2_02_FULL_43_32b TaxID=1802306 RepID=A0A1G2MLI4_9BACT|nr:MAG: hypothetical protein A2743_00015 [Candidatus Taylorbacteria bacterium RIFCSPHIGHO2_01_FULL_43_47]OHA23872.1 MAG: hypothetical protein A3C72_03125 [Candidatus Taylorbacteria bacterium RIFCSPHIGHO2_02_FULL_43_32b]OHA30734.1 MAG: hypothetical protein A3B08_03100 [Candidatus Taylorbacteria bacterium RIFCSPLOWO2_01_FULL_43_44]OHA37473.1 MAG: hypothetical protein A3H57_03410 [Candidatus Taylorbacteria bacterium RIFCSPLOWO2_02_FULL_43_11]